MGCVDLRYRECVVCCLILVVVVVWVDWGVCLVGSCVGKIGGCWCGMDYPCVLGFDVWGGAMGTWLVCCGIWCGCGFGGVYWWSSRLWFSGVGGLSSILVFGLVCCECCNLDYDWGGCFGGLGGFC